MEIEIKVQKKVHPRFLGIRIPVDTEDEDSTIKADTPGCLGDQWHCFIDIETGEVGLSIVGGQLSMLPQQKIDVYEKPRDECTCLLFDTLGNLIYQNEDYVPGFMPGDHYGDYVILEIEGGKVNNWVKPDPTELADWVNGEGA